MFCYSVNSFDIIQNYPINTVIPEHVTRIIYLHYGDGTVLHFKEEEKEVRLKGIIIYKTFSSFFLFLLYLSSEAAFRGAPSKSCS